MLRGGSYGMTVSASAVVTLYPRACLGLMRPVFPSVAYPAPSPLPGGRLGLFPRGQEGKPLSAVISVAGFPRRLDAGHLRRHVTKAAGDRLGCAVPWALPEVKRGDGHVICLDSGGNAMAAEILPGPAGIPGYMPAAGPGRVRAAGQVTVQGRRLAAVVSLRPLTVRGTR